MNMFNPFSSLRQKRKAPQSSRVHLRHTFDYKGQVFDISLGSKLENVNNSVPQNEPYEPWVTKYFELISYYYGDDKCAFDIGANVGVMALILSSLQQRGKVFAFEALTSVSQHLQKNVMDNNINNVYVHQKIISDTDGESLTINSYPEDVGGSFVSTVFDPRKKAYTEEVDTITLDTFVQQQGDLDIKMLKIDVECWETYVLRGAKNTILDHQPITVIEFNVQNRHLDLELRGFEQYKELTSLFDYIFLIDRLSQQLIPIHSYNDLRGAMLTGHFVEDLLCFSDTGFYDYLQPHITTNMYTSYHASKIIQLKNNKGSLHALSLYPDNWCHGHDFFLQATPKGTSHVKLTFHNNGPFPENRITIVHHDELETVVLDNNPLTRTYSLGGDVTPSIYVFVEKTFLAKEHINPNDPRALGIQIKVEEVGFIDTTISSPTLGNEQKLVNPIADFIQVLQHTPAKVVTANTYSAPYHTYFDTFYSYCEVNGSFISLHCDINLQSFHDIRREDFTIANLYKSEYTWTSEGLTCTNKKHIGAGADPRLVSDGKNAYAYIIGYGKAGHPAFLYTEKDDALHPLKGPEGFDWGKNWQPFIKGGRLYIVHDLTPYSVYEINLTTYSLEKRYFVDTKYDLPAHYTHHTQFRGGANALAEGDFVVGIGRASAQPYRHAPFLWSSYQNNSPIIQFVDYFDRFLQKGFNIQDPTCFFKVGKQYYLGLACSETSWFTEQQFLNILLVFDTDNSHKELPSLDNYLHTLPSHFKNGRVNLRKHIFHCDRLQHDVPHKIEFGVQSTGTPGTLVYGPYITIDEPMSLMVELTYLTLQSNDEIAGTFDVCLSKEKKDGSVEFIQLAQCDLQTTHKEMEKASLFFDTSPYIGYKVEFRVMVQEEIELNAFHIRTEQIDHVLSCQSLPSAISHQTINGHRISADQEGYLCFGPYHLIENSGDNLITLHYTSDASIETSVGTFDIAVSSPKDEVTTLIETTLQGTNGVWSQARIIVNLDDYLGYKLETRIHSKKEAFIRVNYITMEKEG